MNNKLLIFLFLLFFQFNQPILGESYNAIQGQLTAQDGSAVAGAKVTLIKIVMDDPPVITTVNQGVTDTNGKYAFQVVPPAENTYFRVKIDSENRSIGSNPIKFKQGQTKLNLNLVLSNVIKGIEHLNFLKDVLILDLLEGKVQITEIIAFENSTSSMVDARENPFIKKIPETAYGVELLDNQQNFKATVSTGKITFALQVPQGRHQLYFRYLLPVENRSFSFDNFLPPYTEEIELIVPKNGPQVRFEEDETGTLGKMITGNKSFGPRVYFSQLLQLSGNKEKVGIRIEGIPLSQKKLFYPAVILAIVLLGGLFWFLKKNPVEAV